jgi:hypothetical protein
LQCHKFFGGTTTSIWVVLFCQLAVGGLYQTGGRMDGEIKQGECGRAFSFGGGCIHVGVVGNIVATVFEQATTMEIVMFLSCFCHGVDKISDHVQF